MTGVQGRYPYVVWNPPDEPNGVITGYRLVFSRSGTSTTRTRTTTTDQTFYIIQSSDIPWTSGDFRVTVSSFPLSLHMFDFSSYYCILFPLWPHRLQLETVLVLELLHQLSHSHLILRVVCNMLYISLLSNPSNMSYISSSCPSCPPTVTSPPTLSSPCATLPTFQNCPTCPSTSPPSFKY